MKVLLTGATGFIGSHILRRLVGASRANWDVAFVARRGSDTSRIRDVETRAIRIDGDMNAIESIEDDAKRFSPDVVIHAAWSGVGGAERNDAAQIANLHASLALVKLARAAGAKAFVGLGSQAEYGPSEGALSESAPTNPTALYGITKLATYHYAQHACAEAGMRFAWVRVFSIYGPGDGPNFMIPSLVRQLHEGKRPALTKGEQRWDYLHVADAADAIVRVAESAEGEGLFNLGSGETTTIRSVVERIRDAIDPSLPLGFGDVAYRPDQVMHLEAKIDRLRALGWSPRIPLDAGLAETVAALVREMQTRVSSGA